MASSTLIDVNESDLVQQIASDDVDWLPYAITPGTYFRVLHVDEATNTVILNYKMQPDTVTPVHGHYCTATAYTLDGEWYYDDLTFRKGDIAFETSAEVHQPITKDKGALLLTTLIGGPGNDKLLENHNDDGSKTLLRTGFFKAFERVTLAEFERIDFEALLE